MAPLERHALGLLIREHLDRVNVWESGFISDLYVTKQHTHLTIPQRLKLHAVIRKYLPQGWEKRFWESQRRFNTPSRVPNQPQPRRSPTADMQMVLPCFQAGRVV